jgi:hypothetical protein
MKTSTSRLPASITAADQEATKKLVEDWQMRFGPLQACSAHFEVEHNGPVRFFPGKVIDYYFRDAAAQVRIDLDTHKNKRDQRSECAEAQPAGDELQRGRLG